MSRRRAFALNLSSQYVAVAAALIHGIVLVPLYLAKIPSVLYGGWLATGSILGWIELLDPGVSAVLQRRVAMAAGGDKRDELANTIGSGLILGLVVACVPLVGFAIAPHLPGWVHLDGEFGERLIVSFRLALLALSASLAAYTVMAVNVGLQLSLGSGTIFTIGSLVGITSTILLLRQGVGLTALPAGLLLRSLTWVAGSTFLLVKWCIVTHVRPRLSRASFAQLRAEIALTFTSRIGIALIDRVEPLIAAVSLGPGWATILTLNGRAYEPVKLVASRIAVALAAPLAHLVGESHGKRVTSAVTRSTSLVLILAAVGVGCVTAMNHWFVTLWVGPQFYGGAGLTAAQGAAALLWIAFAHLTQTVFVLGGIKQSSVAAVVEGMTKLLAIVLLISRLGLIAIPIGSTIASLLVTAWYLPALTARLLGVQRRELLRVVGPLVALGAMLIATGLLVAAALPGAPPSWRMFIFGATTAFLLMSGVSLALAPGMRREVSGLAVNIWQRRLA